MLYRILIVDDEQTIAEAVHKQVSQIEGFELDIYHRTDAAQALALATRHRFDLLISDIEMPGMNGLEMAETIGRLWPACRLIFLTGYQDYAYMRRAVQLSSFDYVLKAGGLRALMDSVRRALDAIGEDTKRRALSLRADNLWAAYRYPLAQACLHDWYMLRREVDPALLDAHFPRLGPDTPVWMLLATMQGEEDSAYSAALAFSRIEEELTGALPEAGVYALAPEARALCLLLQPYEDSENPLFRTRLQETLEPLGQLMQSAFGAPLHFAISPQPVTRAAAASMRRQLAEAASLHSEGASIYVPPMAAPGHEAPFEQTYWTGIEYSFLEADIELFERSVLKLFVSYAKQPDCLRQSLTAFHTLWQMLLAFTHRLDIPFGELSDIFAGLSPQGAFVPSDAAAAIVEAARLLFTLCTDTRRRRKEHSVQIVIRHIQSHMAEDLSLLSLCEIVHLNPSYFSRLFRSVTGQPLSEYVLQARMEKARQLLGSTTLRVQEIASAVGFENASYFATVFRREAGMTPLEYRKQHTG